MPEPATSTARLADGPSRTARLAALIVAAARASATLQLAADALRIEIERAGTIEAASTANTSLAPLRVEPAATPAIISEDEFGTWSRTLIERRVDGRATGGRRCAS